MSQSQPKRAFAAVYGTVNTTDNYRLRLDPETILAALPGAARPIPA